MRVLVRDLKCNLCRCVIQFISRCSPRSTVERAGFLPELADHQNAPWFIIFSCCVKRLVFVTVRLTLTLKHCNFLASSSRITLGSLKLFLPLFDSGIPSLDGFTFSLSISLTDGCCGPSIEPASHPPDHSSRPQSPAGSREQISSTDGDRNLHRPRRYGVREYEYRRHCLTFWWRGPIPDG